MYNKTIIIGRVKGNPERAEGKIGDAMRFTLGNSTIGEDGKEVEVLHRIYAFKGAAKLVKEYVQDGMLVCVEGVLTDARSAIIAERIVFLSPVKKREPDEKN